MATSAELLKAIETGAEIRITIAGEPTGGLVKYSPRYKGDKKPWAYPEGRHIYRYMARECDAVTPAAGTAEEEENVTEIKTEVTSEMIVALAKLREHAGYYSDIRGSFELLDNAGVFAAIDEATGYDVNPVQVGSDEWRAAMGAALAETPLYAPRRQEQTSRCTCPEGEVHHWNTCPEYPDNRPYYGAENIAARAMETRRETIQRAVDLKF